MTVSRLTLKYLANQPHVADCVRQQIINYSALARLICEYYQISQVDAVSAAVRRYAGRAVRRAQQEMNTRVADSK